MYPFPNAPVKLESTLGSGVTTLYTVTGANAVTINSITFNNPSAYDIELTINRANPVSSVVAYSFTLAAGDVVKDNNVYDLYAGDSISVNISTGGTNCMLYGVQLFGVPAQ